MPNRDTQLQKTEEDSRFLAVTNHPKFEPSFKLLQFGVYIMTALGMLTAFLAWLFSLSPLIFIPLMGVVFALAFAALYLFTIKPKIERLEAQAAALSLPPQSSNTERELQREVNKFTSLYARCLNDKHDDRESDKKQFGIEKTNLIKHYEGQIGEREAILSEIVFLRETVKEQQRNVGAFLKVERIEYSEHDFEGHPFPYITFVFEVSNRSVFDAAFEKVKGCLSFWGERLTAEKHFENHSAPIIDAFGGKGDVRVVQRLTPVEADSISKAIKNRKAGTNLKIPEINFKDLHFTVKGSHDYPQVQEGLLRIYGTNVVKLEDI